MLQNLTFQEVKKFLKNVSFQQNSQIWLKKLFRRTLLWSILSLAELRTPQCCFVRKLNTVPGIKLLILPKVRFRFLKMHFTSNFHFFLGWKWFIFFENTFNYDRKNPFTRKFSFLTNSRRICCHLVLKNFKVRNGAIFQIVKKLFKIWRKTLKMGLAQFPF